MKKGNKPGLCPVCGGERKPATTTSPRAVRASVAVSTAPTIVTYSIRLNPAMTRPQVILRNSC